MQQKNDSCIRVEADIMYSTRQWLYLQGQVCCDSHEPYCPSVSDIAASFSITEWIRWSVIAACFALIVDLAHQWAGRRQYGLYIERCYLESPVCFSSLFVFFLFISPHCLSLAMFAVLIQYIRIHGTNWMHACVPVTYDTLVLLANMEGHVVSITEHMPTCLTWYMSSSIRHTVFPI
jgi:hypothetical protein